MNAWGATAMSQDTTLGAVWNVTITSDGDDNTSEFKFDQYNTWNPEWGAGTIATKNSTIGTLTSTSPGNLSFTEVNTKRYTFRMNASHSSYVVMETTADPVTISSVSDNSSSRYLQSVTVSITLSASKSQEETVYVCYTTDNWTSKTLTAASGSGSSYSVDIPAQLVGTTVKYYVLTSTMPSNIIVTKYDLCTLKLNNNSGANYSYTFPAKVSYYWRNEALDNKWDYNSEPPWWDGANTYTVPANNGNIHVGNNNRSGSWDQNKAGLIVHQLCYDIGATDVRTLTGNALTFTDFYGDDPIITNGSTTTHVIGINITGDTTDPLQINPALGDLTISGDINNNNQIVHVYGGSQGAGNGKMLTISGNLSGTGKLIIYNDAKVRISGNSTYTGNTEIQRGDLEIAQGGAVGGGTIYVGVNSVSDTSLARLWIVDGDGGTIVNEPIQVNDSAGYSYRVLGGSNTSGENEFSGSVTLNGSVTVYVPYAGTILYSGTITGSKNIYVTGTGAVKMTGANLYTGQTTIKAGGLVATTLANAGSSSSLGAASGENSIIKIGASAGSLGSLVYTSTSDNNTDRQIQVGDGSVPGDSGQVYVQSTGGGASTYTANPFNAADTAASATRTLTLSGAGAGNNTVEGVIQDNNTGNGRVNLRKEGSGKWILSNVGSTFTGQASIFNGTLIVSKLADASANSSLGKGTGNSVILMSGGNSTGILEYNGSGDTSSRQIQIGDSILIGGGALGGATIKNSGSGALTFSASAFNSPDSAATVARTLTLGGANTSANTISGVIANNNGSAAIAVTKADAGTWILSGANTYGGATTVNGGTLAGVGCASSATTVNSATIAPRSAGSVIGTFSAATLTLNNGSALEWEFDGSSADKVAVVGALTFASSPAVITIKVKSDSEVYSGEVRTMFTFNGTAPNLDGLTINLYDAPHVQSATARISGDGKAVEIVMIPEPGLVALAGLLLLALRKR